jgi:hypothetical protein
MWNQLQTISVGLVISKLVLGVNVINVLHMSCLMSCHKFVKIDNLLPIRKERVLFSNHYSQIIPKPMYTSHSFFNVEIGSKRDTFNLMIDFMGQIW